MFVFQLKLAVLLQKFSKLLIHNSLLTCLKSCVTYITTRDVLRMFNCNFCVKKSQEKKKTLNSQPCQVPRLKLEIFTRITILKLKFLKKTKPLINFVDLIELFCF